MNKEQFLAFHSETCQKLIDTVKKKNSDYTADSSDPFSNFSTVEHLGICSTEQGFLVRLNDKFARIRSFVKNQNLLVKDEAVEDTLIDMANYCILFAGYIKSKK
jgi:hypothetical protein